MVSKNGKKQARERSDNRSLLGVNDEQYRNQNRVLNLVPLRESRELLHLPLLARS